MELLLLEDITGVGKRNDIIVVRDGFALNCLLPQRKALVATPTVRKRYAEQIKRRAEEKETERRVQHDALDALTGKQVQFSRKAAKGDKLYAAITAENISAALKEQHQISIPAEKIQIAEHIKAIGSFQVQVQIGDQSASLQVIVTKEEPKVKAAK